MSAATWRGPRSDREGKSGTVARASEARPLDRRSDGSPWDSASRAAHRRALVLGDNDYAASRRAQRPDRSAEPVNRPIPSALESLVMKALAKSRATAFRARPTCGGAPVLHDESVQHVYSARRPRGPIGWCSRTSWTPRRARISRRDGRYAAQGEPRPLNRATRSTSAPAFDDPSRSARSPRSTWRSCRLSHDSIRLGRPGARRRADHCTAAAPAGHAARAV